MEEMKRPYNPVRHENAAVSNGFRLLAEAYSKKYIYKLMNYLYEWVYDFPDDKHIVEVIRNKIESSINRSYGGFYSATEKLFKRRSPDDFMQSLLGEDEFGSLKKRLEKRSINEKILINKKIYMAFEEVAEGTDKGRHYHIKEIKE